VFSFFDEGFAVMMDIFAVVEKDWMIIREKETGGSWYRVCALVVLETRIREGFGDVKKNNIAPYSQSRRLIW
jgi:hypothetical protein